MTHTGAGPATVLACGFRPFFLLAGVHATLAIPLWWASLQGLEPTGLALPALAWHAHEMFYGFVMAAVAGFLLTAVPGWTNTRPVAGVPLLILVLIWLAGRAAVTLPLGLPPGVAAAVDLAFPLALALAIAPALIRSGKLRNLVFIALLFVLFAANLRFHHSRPVTVDALRTTVDAVLLMVVVVGGRITPAFTASWLKRGGDDRPIKPLAWLDTTAVAGVVALLVVDVLALGSTWAGITAGATALLLFARLSRWRGHRTWREPIVAMLHLAYAWIPVGLGLRALAELGSPVPGAAWLHALTTGAFASMILAVMTRATLGHTGRAITASPATTWAYGAVTVAALCRVFGPVLAPGSHGLWLSAAAALWTLGFVLFLVCYAPMLCTPRADGRPG